MFTNQTSLQILTWMFSHSWFMLRQRTNDCNRCGLMMSWVDYACSRLVGLCMCEWAQSPRYAGVWLQVWWSPPSSLFVGGGFVLLAWLGDREDENFDGSCAKIPKVSTGRSLNSCAYCKISISVTLKALEIFRVIWKCTKNNIAHACDLNFRNLSPNTW